MYRGIDEKHEHGAQEVVRDTRPLGQRIGEFFSNPTYVVMMLGTAAFSCFVMPGGFDLYLLFGLMLWTYATLKKKTLPFRLPKVSHVPDYNDCYPGTSKPKMAMGICFLGNERSTGKELWLTNEDMRTHLLIFGSTGSGKTEALVSIAFNALVQGSGFIYVDGKGDNSLFAKLFSMVRSMGREDDMLLVNFMTGAKDIIGPQDTRLSNTMNPFAVGSSSMLSQLVVSLMGSSGSSPDGDMWKGRAIAFVEAIMKILVAMRDSGHVLLDAHTIRKYFILEKCEQIVIDRMFPLEDGRLVSIKHLPANFLDPIENYLENLPGYNKANKGKQAGEVREQHGFITMQLTRAFSSLADTYGHIIRTNLAEVDFKDVVLNRRILVVLLPALEKAPDELANLGKIIIASLKAMMAAGLGDIVEGEYRDVIQRKPTSAPSPYLCIMDEYGYYAVEGFAVVPAQARSLGFCAVFAGQDLPAFQKASKEEAASIGANCNIKICMKLEDPTETWDFFQKTAGEAYVTNVQSFQLNASSMTNNYMDNRTTSVDRRQRIELLDLKDQREGEAHIFFRSRIVRATMFYANPRAVPKMRLNQFVKVNKPDSKELTELDRRLLRFGQVFSAGEFQYERPAPSQDIVLVAEAFAEYADLPPVERAVAAGLALVEHHMARETTVDAEEITSEMHAYTQVEPGEIGLQLLSPDELELFKRPLINKNTLDESIRFMERLVGKTEAEAGVISESVMRDIYRATKYPPFRPGKVDAKRVSKAILQFAAYIRGEEYTEQDDGLDDL